jgi:polyisoprenoid-binding protein YceI
MKPLLAAALLTFGLAAGAAELTQVDMKKSSVNFLTRQMNVPLEGRFKTFTARIAIDPAKPENGRAAIDIDVASIDSGSQEGDEEAIGKDWFDTARYPKASFVSSGVKPLGGGKYQALGKLTIKGKSKDVSVPFTLRPDAGGLWFEGGFTMRRLEFGVGSGAWGDPDTVADAVQVRFKILVMP